MKIYLLPRLDCIGNLPVLSEKYLENSLVSMMKVMRAPLQGLVASGVGLKYRNSEIERGSSIVLVDWMFFVVLGGVPCWCLVTFVDVF